MVIFCPTIHSFCHFTLFIFCYKQKETHHSFYSLFRGLPARYHFCVLKLLPSNKTSECKVNSKSLHHHSIILQALSKMSYYSIRDVLSIELDFHIAIQYSIHFTATFRGLCKLSKKTERFWIEALNSPSVELHFWNFLVYTSNSSIDYPYPSSKVISLFFGMCCVSTPPFRTNLFNYSDS